MTQTQKKRAEAIANALLKLADRAGKMELELPNGGDVGSLVAGIAYDIKERTRAE